MSEIWTSKKNLVWENMWLMNSVHLCDSGTLQRLSSPNCLTKDKKICTQVTISSDNMEKHIGHATGRTSQRDNFPNVGNIKQNPYL